MSSPAPMPHDSAAERAVGAAMAVAAAQGQAGQGQPELRRDDMHDAVAELARLEHRHAEMARLFAQVHDVGVVVPVRIVAAGIGRDRVVGAAKHQFWIVQGDAALAQFAQRARRQIRHDQAVDMHQRKAVAVVGDHMARPDFLEQGCAGSRSIRASLPLRSENYLRELSR